MKKHVKTYIDYFGFSEGDMILCEVCEKIAIDVHHIQYKSQLGKDVIENLIALCRYHHDCSHFKEKPFLTKETLQSIHNQKLCYTQSHHSQKNTESVEILSYVQ
jgi:predicted restriction endonuclease